MPHTSFLTPNESEEFGKKFLARTVVEAPFDPYASDEPKEFPLTSYVSTAINQMIKKEDSFGCVCVQVHEGDKMTWSAETLNAAIGKHPAAWTRWCIDRKLVIDSLPTIAAVIGVKKFLKLAVKEGLTTSFVSLRWWMMPLIVCTSVTFGAAKMLHELMARGNVNFGNPWPYIVSTALMILGIFVQQLCAKASTSSKSASVQSFRELFEEKQSTRNYSKFIERLAYEIRKLPCPRAFIIDGFERLDQTTRLTIESYFKKQAETVYGLEFWAIFELKEESVFSKIAITNRDAYGFSKTRIVKQIPLPKLADATSPRHEKASKTAWAQLTQYRELHPLNNSRYGDLELFSLLGLGMVPDSFPLTIRFIQHKFAEKTGLQSEILSLLLKGTSLRIDEFGAKLGSLASVFPGLIESETGPQGSVILIRSEIALTLVSLNDKLFLPPVPLGHLFWSIFWYDHKVSKVTEPFWIRRLAFHLLNADVSLIDDPKLRVETAGRIFEIIMEIVGTSLRLCFFQHIQGLLEKGLFLLQEDETEHNSQRQKRYVRECWKAYSVLGEERLLGYVLELAPSGWPIAEANSGERQDRLGEAFLESIPLTPSLRIGLKSAPSFDAKVPRASLESANDHARVCAAWLALVSGSLIPKGTTGLRNECCFAVSEVEQVAHRAWERVASSSEDSLRITDVLTLSLALWCHALGLSPSINACKVKDIDHLHNFEAAYHRFSSLLEKAQDAVTLAGELKKENSESIGLPRGRDFILDGLGRELCTFALGSVVFGYHNLSSWGFPAVEKDDWVARLQDIVTYVSDMLNCSFPSIDRLLDALSKDMTRSIFDLMTACRILWAHFGLERLLHLANARRIQFAFMTQLARPEDNRDFKRLHAEIDMATANGGFTGIIANLVFSECMETGSELASYYVNRAASLALQDNFGEELRDKLSFLAISLGHAFRWKQNAFVAQILEDSGNGSCWISRNMDGLEDPCNAFLAFFNVLKSLDNDELTHKLVGLIDRMIDKTTVPEDKEELKDLKNFNLLEQDLSKGRAIDVDAVLKSWRSRRDRHTYPFLLSKLIRNGYASEAVLKDARKILKRNPLRDSYTSWFLLALAISFHYIDQPKSKASQLASPAIDYLKSSIESFEAKNSIDTNLDAYRALSILDSSRSEYIGKIGKWQTAKIKRDHLERIPQLVGQGAFFLIFQDYFNSMRFWGLRTELPFSQLNESINVDHDVRLSTVKKWREKGGDVPPPFVVGTDKTIVSADFMRIGHFLFSAPNNCDTSLDEHRMKFNAIARSNIKPLLSAINSLPELPPFIKELLQSYSKMMLERIHKGC